MQRAAAVCGQGRESTGIPRLAAKSIVVLDPETGRYNMHKSLREYAAGKLNEAGKAETLRALHLRYFAELAEAAEQPMRGAQQAEWLALLEAEQGGRAGPRQGQWDRTERVGSGEAVGPVEDGLRKQVAVLRRRRLVEAKAARQAAQQGGETDSVDRISSSAGPSTAPQRDFHGVAPGGNSSRCTLRSIAVRIR